MVLTTNFFSKVSVTQIWDQIGSMCSNQPTFFYMISIFRNEGQIWTHVLRQFQEMYLLLQNQVWRLVFGVRPRIMTLALAAFSKQQSTLRKNVSNVGNHFPVDRFRIWYHSGFDTISGFWGLNPFNSVFVI